VPAFGIHVRPLRLGKSTRRLADNPACYLDGHSPLSRAGSRP
jgi:hypothetical protein